MTPIERLEHIEQCVVRMKPTTKYELEGAAEIKKELAALKEIFTRLGQMLEVVRRSALEDGETYGEPCG